MGGSNELVECFYGGAVAEVALVQLVNCCTGVGYP